MLPRHAADYKTLLWVFVLAPGVVALQYANPSLVPYLSWVSVYLAIATSRPKSFFHSSLPFMSKA